MGGGRRKLAVGLLMALLLLAAGCDRDRPPPGPPEDPRRPTIRLASFDFPESELLAQLYGQALRQHGFPVELVVQQAFAPRGVSVLAYAPAQDRNGFVVSGDLARRHGLEKLSDLTPMARRLSFGGPPECAQRPLCLEGLEDVYKLRFARFEPMPSRDVTAAALGTGEIDVGMIDTTDPNLLKPGTDLVQLADDKRLQPADNVVPVVRREIVDAYGPPLVRLVNAVSARLSTADLTSLNRQVADGQPAAQVATAWLRAHTIIS